MPLLVFFILPKNQFDHYCLLEDLSNARNTLYLHFGFLSIRIFFRLYFISELVTTHVVSASWPNSTVTIRRQNMKMQTEQNSPLEERDKKRMFKLKTKNREREPKWRCKKKKKKFQSMNLARWQNNISGTWLGRNLCVPFSMHQPDCVVFFRILNLN